MRINKLRHGSLGSFVVFGAIFFFLSPLQTGEIVISRFFLPTIGISLGFVFLVVTGFVNSWTLTRPEKLLSVFICLQILVSLFGSMFVQKEFFAMTAKVCLAWMAFWVAYNFMSTPSMKVRKIFARVFLSTSICFLIIEAWERISSVGLVGLVSAEVARAVVYEYKYNSLFFPDSNSVGVYTALCIVCLVSFFETGLIGSRAYKIWLSVLLSLCALSFSITAFIGVVVFFLCRQFYELTSDKRIIVFLSLSIAVAVGLPSLVALINMDGSGSTKIEIWMRLLPLLSGADWLSLFFGLGLEDGSYAYSYEEGKHGHALVPLLLGQVGLIGLSFYFLSMFMMFFQVRQRSFKSVVITILVMGLSYCIPYYEFMFIAIGVLFAGQVRRLSDEQRQSEAGLRTL